ncbi:D-alanyl-D-alanine carboxypeptidase/D-alanyl-D-alanine endopeptidase [Micromonospora sp. DT4]|uniref:D-alanyl-D-alanine carboxypeptidase/D-alanyl-D-alanine endopeptidase n=1 Tax=Micromonospora sp. DT4 TaxID=3393438 RepID=UPI003CF44C05
MHRRLFPRAVALLALVVTVATVGASGATAESPTPATTRLRATIDAILADNRLAGAQTSVVVVDTSTGETLYDRNGNRRLVPASNTKLLTSTAALGLLGPGHHFSTDVQTIGARRGGLLSGNLYLRGGGDPTMLAADYDALAAQVAAAGVRVVTGNLVADDTRYDRARLGSFRAALRRHGVRMLGRTVLGEPTPETAHPVARHDSMSLGELMTPFLKLSNNGHAEVLTKEIGRVLSGTGTWSAGLTAISEYVADTGMDTGTLRQRDGSGLSRRNLVPAAEFVDLLAAVRAQPWFATWYAALPIAGQPERFVGGTLRSRMAGTPAAGNVHAKTGSLTGVSGLSGYVTSADGHLLAFSILLNNYLTASVKALEDQIAVTLAGHREDGVSAARVARPEVPQAPRTPEGVECSWVKPITC